MKAFYYEFFHIPKEGKLREKVLMSHVALTAVLIIVYLLAISGSAYAFHTSATRVQNTIMAANFDAESEVETPSGDALVLEKQKDGMLLAMLEEKGEYRVVLEPGGTAETGFVTMQLNGDEYITAQLGTSVEEEDEYRDEISFTIGFYEDEPTPVAFMSHWGTSTAYATYTLDNTDASYYLLGDEVIIIGDPNSLFEPSEEETEEAQTEEEQTEEEQSEEEQTEEEQTEGTEYIEETETTEETVYIEQTDNSEEHDYTEQ